MGIVDTAAGAPHPILAGLVVGYLGYRLAGFAPGTHLGLPCRTLVVEVSLAAPVRIAVPGRPPNTRRWSPAWTTGPPSFP